MSADPIRVLLADDHAVVRAGVRQFLEQAPDIDVIAEADDGQMAKTLIRAHMPDVAVLDIRMPLANGVEVARWVKRELPTTAVLVLSAYDDDPYITAVLQAGAEGYMLKTAPPTTIIQAVRDVHAGKSVIGHAIAEKLVSAITKRPSATAEYEALTEREMDVLRLAGKGQTNKAIGVGLGISSRTVQGHLANIYAKLHVNSRTEAVMRAVSLGWLETE